MVVSLDPSESFCGCGGKGHLEGIMGHRAMRLRFLDLEPEEIFAGAAEGDERCCDFELLWHRALAALALCDQYPFRGTGEILYYRREFTICQDPYSYPVPPREMVTMTALQGSVFEVIAVDEDVAITGAAVHAEQS